MVPAQAEGVNLTLPKHRNQAVPPAKEAIKVAVESLHLLAMARVPAPSIRMQASKMSSR